MGVTKNDSTMKSEAEEEVAWTLDGEYGGSPRLVEIENLQQALNLCLKSDK